MRYQSRKRKFNLNDIRIGMRKGIDDARAKYTKLQMQHSLYTRTHEDALHTSGIFNKSGVNYDSFQRIAE